MNNLEEIKNKLEKLRRFHHTCEDNWYSCPKSGECCDDSQGNDCNCGADWHNKILEEALALIEAQEKEALRNKQAWEGHVDAECDHYFNREGE
jgi:hypothetical protein